MDTATLRLLLKSLCRNSPWIYALFWKLRHWSPLTLTWEDSYCVYPESNESSQNMSHDVFGGFSIGLIVDNMSHLQYTWGEGVIGKVAHTANHCWVSYDDFSRGNIDSCPEEWQFQFISGIKTIAHIPVLPHGVLQLGCLETVTEDLEVVSDIQGRFMHYSSGGNTDSFSFSTISEESLPFNQSMKVSQFEMVENELFGLSCLEEEPITYLPWKNYSLNDYEYFDEQHLQLGNNSDFELEALSSFFSFPKHCELHKALGPAFQEPDTEFLFSSSKSGIEPLSMIKEGDNAAYQLQAMDASIHRGSGSGSEETSNEFGEVKSLVTSTVHGSDVVAACQVLSASVSGDKNDLNVASLPCLSRSVSTLTDAEKLQHMKSKKARKLTNVTKRRAKVVDNGRQRPRDRQLIQDRVKELRELVPDGAKCSIDGLLDKTIKHMLYLSSMMNQAEKLTQWVHQEVYERKNLRSSRTKDDYQEGTSWGFEIEDEPQVCPIVVEDLPHPGHLLIEMLCNEHRMFLEIAQVIQSFDLVILNGVIEGSEEKTWAHFIVEASRGFRRLYIFRPLMQLLQRRRRPISSKIKVQD